MHKTFSDDNLKAIDKMVDKFLWKGPRLLDPSQIARAKKLGGLGLARAKQKNLATLCQWIRTLRFSDELWCKYLIDTINEQGGIRGLRRSKPVGRLWECIIPAMRTILKFFIASGSWHKREEKVFGNDEILSLDAHDFRLARRFFLYIKDFVDDDGRTREASGRDISFLEKLKFTRICTVIKNKYPLSPSLSQHSMTRQGKKKIQHRLGGRSTDKRNKKVR